MSNLPRSVQAQIDAAEAIQQDLMKAGETPAPEADSESAVPDAAPAVDSAPDKTVDPNAQPAAQPSPAALERENDAAYWQQRFRVIQGKYDAELPALRKEINRLTEALQQAQAAKPQEPTPTNDVQRAAADLTEEELKSYGPELVSIIRRVAAGMTAGNPTDLASVQSEVANLREATSQLAADRVREAQERFFEDLRRLVPDVLEVNSSQDFHLWLSQLDQITGKVRQQLLEEAQEANDPHRVAAMFQAFKNTLSQKSPDPQPRREIPADQIQPAPNRSTAAPVPQGERWWTNSEINQFYKDKALGKVDSAKAAEIEKSIQAAVQEGRIRQ
ncbi:hypothetical protein ACUHOO_000787 [Pseudomonas aeruginosa]|jgi:hypothetical protein|uniref:hypothetical protein n=1 Tax=Pseudomonas aeruginosa TaxID=287 RepID=UPI0003100E52|nr:hypothetical protein [Pseudomonas aeruginosa]EIU3316463.1 hypothetical protein [Pseudomonas aeruginosa]EIY2512146.1 hypothetical protein [Pseudomonas aeruginosa]EIY2820318.1 hypothetical protein [Pseudomonas aeruginosa]EKT8668876.1 hypothetical protein [Pseudomonas aeruginosa]EKU2957369.1 hypothetical protein [Pseudomonas aeruginosa]